MTDRANADTSEPDAAQQELRERAAAVGLTLVAAEDLRIVRRRAGRGFSYLDAAGKRIADSATLERIRALAIPPAYREVRIAEDPQAHLQAVGRDEAGRLQHRYHPAWTEVREDAKLQRLALLIAALPKLRAAVRRDLASPRLTRDKALACAVALIDKSHIRVGCEAYVRSNGSHGAATLLKRQVAIRGPRIDLHFRGKGGKDVTCAIEEPRLARSLSRFARQPGRRLLQYPEGGRLHRVSADDINAYLRRVTGVPITAKDLRMLGAGTAAAEAFLLMEPGAGQAAQRRQAAQVMRTVAELLVNTPAVARKSYVPALVVQSFADGSLRRAHRRTRGQRHRRRIENVLAALVARAD